jgi:Tfp pilus assembly PilM family ATPase
VVDYHLVGMDKPDMEDKKKVLPNPKGVLAIASQEEIGRKRKIAEDALLKCVLMDSDGLALLNCLKEIKQDSLSLPAAVINMGMSGTILAILNKDGLPFIRDLRHSGSDIVGNIEKDIKVTSVGAGQKIAEANDQIDIIKKCQGLIYDINETLAYYSAKDGTIRHIYLCGGLSQYESVVKTLAENINGEVSVWNPFSDMKFEGDIPGGQLIKNHGGIFAVAAGLAMRQV